MEIPRLTEDVYECFVREWGHAVILFDAPWDVGPGRTMRPLFLEAARTYGDRVGFGEVNVDEFVRRPGGVAIANVPVVVYYRRGKVVAEMVGAGQDVSGWTQALLDGEPIRWPCQQGPGPLARLFARIRDCFRPGPAAGE